MGLGLLIPTQNGLDSAVFHTYPCLYHIAGLKPDDSLRTIMIRADAASCRLPNPWVWELSGLQLASRFETDVLQDAKNPAWSRAHQEDEYYT